MSYYYTFHVVYYLSVTKNYTVSIVCFLNHLSLFNWPPQTDPEVEFSNAFPGHTRLPGRGDHSGSPVDYVYRRADVLAVHRGQQPGICRRLSGHWILPWKGKECCSSKSIFVISGVARGAEGKDCPGQHDVFPFVGRVTLFFPTLGVDNIFLFWGGEGQTSQGPSWVAKAPATPLICTHVGMHAGIHSSGDRWVETDIRRQMDGDRLTETDGRRQIYGHRRPETD